MSSDLLSRRSALVLGALPTLAAWPAAAPALESRATATMLRAAADYLDAWNRHDAQAVAAAFHPEGVRQVPYVEGSLRGAAILADAQAAFSAFSDFHVEVGRSDVAGEGRMVKEFVFAARWTGVFAAGALAGKAPTGRRFALPAAEIIEFADDGRIRASRVYYDRLALLVQIGALPGA